MSKKFKDYYDIKYSYDLAKKIAKVYKEFNIEYFIKLIEPTIEDLKFNDRQTLIARSLYDMIPYPLTIPKRSIF